MSALGSGAGAALVGLRALVEPEPVFSIMGALAATLGALLLAGPLAHGPAWRTATVGALGAGLALTGFQTLL